MKNVKEQKKVQDKKEITIEDLKIDNEDYYKISNYDEMRPFFMSIVSDSNHWMFISSNGGLSAGRKNAENALFPYYTDDKITESSEITGSKTIILANKNNDSHLWEPFSERYYGIYNTSRNIYKNTYGNKILFEEINHDLELTFRYQWNSSNKFGFVRKSALINNSESNIELQILDGIQNILPCGVGSDLQNASSNLVDAYKRSELIKDIGLGIYALSAIIVDRAEPSEALKANIVWSYGIDNPKILLSSLQLKNFRNRLGVQEEVDVKAEKGAYLITTNLLLSAKGEKKWMIAADVNKNHSTIVKLSETLRSVNQIDQLVEKDIDKGTKLLIELNATSDGIQLSADKFRDSRHFANSLFNIMRGGVFDNNYQIEKWDLKNYLSIANKKVFANCAELLNSLPESFSLFKLKEIADQTDNKDFKRLCSEYMPLKFSRRHGDPSRPWNKFSINTRSEIDGSKILDYEGNWRDIFQNWEALAHSFPNFIESMIHKFLNATTFEGYNPYRVTKSGFDWETIEPDNPWSYIGYWGDHQIIYLLKFLEFIENKSPGRLESYFDKDCFVYANVPYRIKSYQDILKNSKDTIEFDFDSDNEIEKGREEIGSDASLLMDENHSIYTVNFVEKILATLLAKLSNFIPEGGIWMNTQRPEWNDANNALVGNGVSMVTLYYLRRFLIFFNKQLADSNKERIEISNELIIFYKRVVKVFEDNQHLLSGKINNTQRKQILDELGEAGSDYRTHIYKQKFWGEKRTISINGLKRFVDLSLKFLEHTIDANKREDNLYHAYNLMTIEDDNNVSISYLSEMLEGQVAVLSSGYLSPQEALYVLDALKRSKLFRDDQYSYVLYPNKNLPRFMDKNTIPKDDVEKSELLMQLIASENKQVIDKDVTGDYHFNGNIKNANDLKDILDSLSHSNYSSLTSNEISKVLNIFEGVFNHKAFTGRSGTFYGYEGLGSIYWHMVSKLQLAVQECCFNAVELNASEEIIGRLLEHYYEINEGIGVHKPPSLYGAFPTDPYSHTPAGRGAQQPGMTGQVKEDILSRFGELGVFVKNGKLYFNPCLLRKDEFINSSKVFKYVDVSFQHKEFNLEENSLCFTYCQVPIIFKISDKNSLEVIYKDGSIAKSNDLSLDLEASQKIFERTGDVTKVIAHLNKTDLR
ncbi:MAG: hypothetical protein HKO66_01535 [Saprospiraceae bacterium]|nr:hypothetical protein [Bacteroidia bacterium]NNE15798.1 hypothetical protein [Saprospiraceae bacterium]NNL90891.1 hypothetical protein [Saprospiraceae bacterium]